MESKLSEERIAELLESEERLKRMRDTAQRASRRRLARINVLVRKAKEQGLTVSEEEIEAELKRVKSK